ncbi:hypothetical protein [Synechococcus phage BUCT-ZZ01]|nr:hypothetical protein [Synechococcus phage BUCT-ZZ01]
MSSMSITKTVKMFSSTTGEELLVAVGSEHMIDKETFVLVVDRAKKRVLRYSASALSTQKPSKKVITTNG